MAASEYYPSMRQLDALYPALEVSTVPVLTPVSHEDLKAYVDYDDDDRDELFRGFVKAATEKVEHDLERALCTQTIKAYFEDFPFIIELHKPPVSAVTSITYVDQDGDTQTVGTSVYQVDLKNTPPRICEAYGQVWPSDVKDDTLNAVIVTFTAGYGEPKDVPFIAKQMILMQAKRLYEGCEMGEGDSPLYQAMCSSLRWRPMI